MLLAGTTQMHSSVIQEKYLLMSSRGEESSNHRKCIAYMLEMAKLTGRTFVIPNIEGGKITDPNVSLTNVDDYFVTVPREFVSVTMKPHEFFKRGYELEYDAANSSLTPWKATRRVDGSTVAVTIKNIFQQGFISAADYLKEHNELFMGDTSIIVMMERQ